MRGFHSGDRKIPAGRFKPNFLDKGIDALVLKRADLLP